mgnify:CR=1 FL=1|jgi:exosortase A
MSTTPRSSEASEIEAGGRKGRATLAGIAFYCLVLVLLFHDTIGTMIGTWSRSETFSHGFLVLPISLWLIWRQRIRLAGITARPIFTPVVALGFAGLLWYLARMTDVLVVQQLALVTMVLAGIWMLAGTRVVYAILFPLLFLYFAVPMGEGLIPPMMKFTAEFTVALVRLTGIPVYQEGLYFSLPSGNWSVVEACSGVRYLIASLMLGCLFAYLNYTSWLKRSAFILASIIVPIIANGLRAYIIVMIGHLSGMELAAGVDHLIYGWIFFGLVIFILFAIGLRWRDHVEARPAPDANPNAASDAAPGGNGRGIRHVLPLAIVVVVIWPVMIVAMAQQSTEIHAPLTAPDPAPGLRTSGPTLWGWRLLEARADRSVVQHYVGDDAVFGLYLYQYTSGKPGAEVVRGLGSLLGSSPRDWIIIESGDRRLSLKNEELTVNQHVLASGDTRLLVWSWYRIGDRHTANSYLAKIMEAIAKVTFGRTDSARIILATNIEDQYPHFDKAARALQEFAQRQLPAIENSLDRVVGESP